MTDRKERKTSEWTMIKPDNSRLCLHGKGTIETTILHLNSYMLHGIQAN